MSGVLIIGAGGQGRCVADILRAAGETVSGFLDDTPELAGQVVDGVPVLGPVADAARHVTGGRRAIVGIGRADLRRRFTAMLQALEVELAVAVHPSAWVAPSAVLGAGTVVGPQAAVNHSARLGLSCIVNTAAVVEHDCRLGDFVHVAPGARLCGSVQVGDDSWLGAGSVVIEGRRIGARVLLGAGGVLVRDLPDDTRAWGVPARIHDGTTEEARR